MHAWRGPLKAKESEVKVWHKFYQIPSSDVVNYTAVAVQQRNLCSKNVLELNSV